MYGTLLAGSAILGGIQGYNSNKIKSIQAKTSAKLAKMNAKNKALELNMNFNDAMASNMVMSAAQNRRGGSVDAVARSMENEFEWDIAFAAFEGEMGYSSKMGEAESYKQAGYMSAGMGLLNAGVAVAKADMQQSQIGGKSASTTSRHIGTEAVGRQYGF